MKRKPFLQLITLFLFILLPFSVAKADLISKTEAENWALSKGEKIIEILAEKNLALKYEQLDNILNEDIDLDNAARFVVGKYWRNMTENQRLIYVPLFKRYVAGLYKEYPLNLAKGEVDFAIDKVVVGKKSVEVWCKIKINELEKHLDKQNQGGFNVLFVLVKNNGRIQVQDLKIAESSLLLAFRDRFYKMIHQDSDDEIDWFLEDFETLVIDNEQKNAQNLEMMEFNS